MRGRRMGAIPRLFPLLLQATSSMKKHLTTFICTLALLLSPLFAHAAAVSPSVIELSSSLGGVIDSSFTIFNTGASEQVYFLDLLAFEPNSEDGTPMFTPEASDQNELLSWIDFPVREASVPAQSKVEVPFNVAVPDDVASGSYYGAITVSTAPSDIVASNGAMIEAKTAILVFLTIEGETIEKLELLDFALEQTDASHPFGLFSFRIQNQGNVYLAPAGEIRLTGLFGQTIVELDANPTEGRVLPGSTRTFTVVYESPDTSWLQTAGYQLRHLAMGPVTAELQLVYGADGRMEATWSFWMFPSELINVVLVVVAIFLLVFLR